MVKQNLSKKKEIKMKKNIYIAGAMAIMAASSCSIEESKMDRPAITDGPKLTLEGETYPQTRFSIGEKDGNTYPLLWENGDVISIWSKNITSSVGEDSETVLNGNIKGEQAQLFGEDAGKASGLFQTNNAFSVDNDEDIVITYPGTIKYSDGKVLGMIENVQEQRKPNSSMHVGNYALAFAKTSLKAGQTEGVKFSLSQKTAFVKLSLSTTEFADMELVGAKLYSAGSVLSGKVSYDVEAGKMEVTGGADNISVKLRTPEKFSNTQDLYFTALPCDLTGKETYVIITMKDATKTVTIPAKVNGGLLSESCLSVIKIDNISLATNTCEWYEPVETRYIAAFGEGWSYGPSNCFVAYYDGEAVTFDVKARGNFAKCTRPASILVHNACEANIKNKTNLEINGVNGYDGEQYVKFPLDNSYTVSIKALAAGVYTGYSSKVKLLDENDNCIWCFNIWGNKEQLQEQTYKNGVMLDRNIGSDSSKGFGYMSGSYYQWGRPFQTGWSSSGGLFNGAPTNITDLAMSAAKPETFFHMKGVNPTQGGDWYLGAHTGARTEHLDDLWGNQNLTGEEIVQTNGTKSIYDPCPKGYMVASPKILAEMFKVAVPKYPDLVVNGKTCYKPGTTEFTDGNKFTDPNFMEYKLPDGTTASWPFSGCKWGSDGGNCDNNTQDICACWSNSTTTSYDQDAANAYCFVYRYKTTPAWKQVQNGNRAHGYPVRCMKDTENR